jgi:hypothetical protein
MSASSLLQSLERFWGPLGLQELLEKPKKKSAQTGRSFLYSNKPKQGYSLLRISRSPVPLKFEFTTLLLQMTTPQTRVNAEGLFTTLFACLRL